MVTISVAVVEDDPLLRRVIADILAADAEIQVLGEFSNSLEFVKTIFPINESGLRSHVNVAVMDVWPDRQVETEFRVPDATETFTFMRAAGLPIRAVFVTSMGRSYVEAACYAVSGKFWDYVDKSSITKGSELVAVVKRLASRQDQTNV